ncbi:MAG TPA: cobalt ECF transporter T component CbiQ [Caldisericia bacterium]|nr:cobalt ECF transporter T component CbiQ [Caldisericia bacterium]HPF49776.1 cobalt ECF transporter T component CbiQ [Caldisericia bacterium]HPI84337.1 cobalt ECF transporter T component CbiQ [Caldisericia bacterium]HPQ93764.1 cobalt ECF transporter T component CbiQ [Caldisericia bacterium]HRV74812.1 cobalt ECF transporter T component CbiQ [Caldisericia bacterium]
MKHDFFDSHCHHNSILNGLDPRVKLIVTLFFVVAVTILPPNAYLAHLAYLVTAFVFMIASRVHFSHYLQSLLVITPLIGALALAVPFMSPAPGGGLGLGSDLSINSYKLVMLFSLVSKTVLTYLFALVLLFSTSFVRLMVALEGLKVAPLFVAIANFAYRYQFIIVDETERLVRSRNSRLWRPRFITQAKTIGYMIGTLFLRSYERSERVYMAMSSRGFNGKFITHEEMRLKPVDLIYSSVSMGSIALIWVLLV